MVSGAGSRGCDPREGPAAPGPELAQLSFTWLFLSWLFIDGVFLVREAQLAPPALHLQEDKEMELGEGAQLLPPPHVAEAVPGVPRGSSEPLQRPWSCRWSLLWLTLLEGDETLETLSVAVAGSSEPSACLWH